MKIDLSKAIKEINSTAEFCYAEEDANTIEWLNGTTPISKQTILNKQIELQEIEDNRIENQETNKQSALNKLKALGLNDAEINSILGK
jgi:hypothetical protein